MIAASASRNIGSATSARNAGTASRRISRSWVRLTCRPRFVCARAPQIRRETADESGSQAADLLEVAAAPAERRGHLGWDAVLLERLLVPGARPDVDEVGGVRLRRRVVGP